MEQLGTSNSIKSHLFEDTLLVQVYMLCPKTSIIEYSLIQRRRQKLLDKLAGLVATCETEYDI